MKHQRSKSAEPPRGGEAQKAPLFEGEEARASSPRTGPRRLGLKNTSLLGVAARDAPSGETGSPSESNRGFGSRSSPQSRDFSANPAVSQRACSLPSIGGARSAERRRGQARRSSARHPTGRGGTCRPSAGKVRLLGSKPGVNSYVASCHATRAGGLPGLRTLIQAHELAPDQHVPLHR